MRTEDISTAPKDGTPILAECDNNGSTYVVSVAYWTVEMLRTTDVFSVWKADDEYWSHTSEDFCCNPVRWFPDFVMPERVEVQP